MLSLTRVANATAEATRIAALTVTNLSFAKNKSAIPKGGAF
jgi:hypothetical protein